MLILELLGVGGAVPLKACNARFPNTTDPMTKGLFGMLISK